jgi:glutathione S-transferase
VTALLRLHGYAVSNYVSIVHAALIEKQLPYEIVPRGAERDDAFLALNPMGKIPVLETEEGCVAETVAILDYLDDRFAANPLRPDAPFSRARMRQINNVLQLYIEAPARSLYVGVFAAGHHDDRQLTATRAMLDRATVALARLAIPGPFLVGATLTQADLFAFFTLELVDRLSRHIWNRSLVEELGWATWQADMQRRESIGTVLAAFATSFRTYLRTHDAPFREPSSSNQEMTHA